MILGDKAIKEALKNKSLIIIPQPSNEQIDTTTVDLRIGKPIWVWNPDLVNQSGISVNVDINDNFSFPNLKEFLKQVKPQSNGQYCIKPKTFYLASTFEKIGLPSKSQLAARIEGKSSLARLGLVVHMTAPTIQCGYGEEAPGIITLEIFNYGPFPILVTPGESFVCQLIIECVKGQTKVRTNKTFTKQKSPKGD